MIVIPPTVQSEKYFTNMANRIWKKYITSDSEAVDGMKGEHKTLVISCDLDLEEGKSTVKLHYRFIKEELYCFVEEIFA